MRTASRTLHLRVEADYAAMGRAAAEHLISRLQDLTYSQSTRPLNIILSAGRTPIGLYELLASEYQTAVPWASIQLFQMDELIRDSVPGATFKEFLTERVVTPLGISRFHHIEPATEIAGWTASIRRVERALVAAGGLDLVVHGIGTNGHIGFNEPGTAPDSAARTVALAPSTQAAVDPPDAAHLGVTLGLGILLKAKETMLLASGAGKAGAIADALDGPVSSTHPASWLRATPRLDVIVDQDAASQLQAT